MAKFKIDLKKWNIIFLEDPSKVYSIPLRRKQFLELLINSNGETVSAEYIEKYFDIPRATINDTYIYKLKKSILDKFNIKKDSELAKDLYRLIVYDVTNDGYYFDNSNDTFEIAFPSRPIANNSDTQNIDALLCNNLINTINENRKINDKFIQNFFPKIRMSNNQKVTHFDLINKIKNTAINGKCIIIESESATGKSSILRKICRTNDLSIYPILITASEIQATSISSEIIYRYTNGTKVGSEDSLNQFINLLNILEKQSSKDKSILPLILIDGYDEMTIEKCEEVLNFITKILKDKTNNANIIITTRYVNRKMKECIEKNPSLFEISYLQPLDHNVLGDYKNKVKIKKITPLIAKYYTNLSSKKLTSNLIIDNRYQLYEQYYEHIFKEKQGYITKYKNIYPYIAFKSIMNDNLVIDNFYLKQLPDDALCNYPEIFEELDVSIAEDTSIPTLIEFSRDLIRSDLLVMSKGHYYFKHNEIKLFMAAKFINMRLNSDPDLFDSIFEESTNDIIEKLTTSSIEDIYNKYIDYCEFCFMAIVEASKNKTFNNYQQDQLLKCGLLIGYHQGYSLYSILKPQIDSYLEKLTALDFTTIASINDYLYSILTTDLEENEKKRFVSDILYTLTLCKKRIEAMKTSNIPLISDTPNLFGSAKSILEMYENTNSFKTVYDAMLGVLHGNLGACHLEMANKVHTNDTMLRKDEIEQAIKNHEIGIQYKQSSWGALHRNYISLATDAFYMSKCQNDIAEKREYLKVAIDYYYKATEELHNEEKKHSGSYNTIDIFVIPFNKAGCLYELSETYEKVKDKLCYIEDLQLSLLDGFNSLYSYLSDDNHVSPHYISRNINNIYNDLTKKYLKLFSSEYKKAKLNASKPRFSLNKELIKEISRFCDIYNKISFFNSIKFDSTEFIIREEKNYD